MDLRCLNCKSRFPIKQELGEATLLRCTCERDRKNLKIAIQELHRRGLSVKALEDEYISKYRGDRFSIRLKPWD